MILAYLCKPGITVNSRFDEMLCLPCNRTPPLPSPPTEIVLHLCLNSHIHKDFSCHDAKHSLTICLVVVFLSRTFTHLHYSQNKVCLTASVQLNSKQVPLCNKATNS